MKNEELYRQALINNTIRLVAEGGFEKATTRAISSDRQEENNAKLNEAYIYRLFETKEGLFEKTFAMLDEELVRVIRENIVIFKYSLDFRGECRKLFLNVWRFLLKNDHKCRYYTRYYYSVYFRKEVCKAHMKRFERLVEMMTPYFAEKADIWSILRYVISSMLDFAIRVYDETLDDTEDNAEHIFRVLYSSISPYLKEEFK